MSENLREPDGPALHAAESSETRIRRDNERDALALARLYAHEDSDRGFLARQVIRLIEADRG